MSCQITTLINPDALLQTINTGYQLTLDMLIQQYINLRLNYQKQGIQAMQELSGRHSRRVLSQGQLGHKIYASGPNLAHRQLFWHSCNST